jgi:hypothetical protein
MVDPSARHLRRFSAVFAKHMIFIGIKGKTQGVKFSNIPPKAAVRSKINRPAREDTANEKFQPKRSNRTPPEFPVSPDA